MKIVIGILIVVAVLSLGFAGFNEYIYQQKQAPPEQSMILSGTSWTWVATELANGGRMDAPVGGKFVLTFGEDGSVSSTTDCNSLSGGYTQNSGALSFSPFAMTKMYCEGSVEGPYAEQLSQTNAFAVDGDTIRLSIGGDMGTMTFVRVK